MEPLMLEAFGLDPQVVHLNHGAFGVAPTRVRIAAAAWRERADQNPHRFNRVDVRELIAQARVHAATYLGVAPDQVAWVRNVSEAVSAVLGSLELTAGDELVISNHGYGAVRIALGHWASRRGVVVREARFGLGAEDDRIVAAYAAACTPRTRLVVADQITSSTATVLPVAAIAAAVGAPVLVDAAHVPGSLPTVVGDLGATWWVGNLHKWAYTPRGSALLWHSPSAPPTSPGVLSWQLGDGWSRAFDYPGTWDYAAWLAAPDGLDFWAEIGGWERVDRLADLVGAGQKHVAEALGTSLVGLPVTPAPTMRLVRLPDGVLRSGDDVDRVYEWLSTAQRVEVAPIHFDGSGYVRIAAAPYNSEDDYDRLAEALRQL